MEKLKKRVGSRVRDLRKAAGFRNVESLASKLEVSGTSVYEIERGENWVSPDMALALSKALKCRISDLFDVGEPIPRPPKLALFELVAALNDDQAEQLLAAAELTFSKKHGPSPGLSHGEKSSDDEGDPKEGAS